MKKLIIIFLLLFASNIYAADTKVSGLTADASPGTDSLLYTIADPGGTAASRKSTIAQVLTDANIPNDLTITSTSALTATTIQTGQGATEVYAMDQAVQQADSPTFNALTLTTDLTVPNGGTGASTFTDGGILLGSGANAITALGAASNGQIPIGDGTTDPQLGTITGTANEITVTNGAGSITLSLTDPIITGVTGNVTGALTGNADTATTATTANAGDSATAFFSSGTIEHEYGGLEADVNAYSGIVAISGGSTSEVDAKSELETQIADVADFAEADGDTWTGVHDAGGADSFEIPNGAAITIDASGEIGVDSTKGQLIYASAATARVLPYINTRCAVIENLAAADDNLSIGAFGQAATIMTVGCSYVGTGTVVAQISLEDGGGNAMTHEAPTCTAHGTDFAFRQVTAGGSLNSGELLRIDVDNAVDPETDDYTVCYEFIWDRQ